MTLLTIGVASSALFDLTESDRVFREQGGWGRMDVCCLYALRLLISGWDGWQVSSVNCWV